MALTRRLLEGMGIDDKQIQTIIDEHRETVDALKQERDNAQTEAEKVPDLQKKLEEALEAAKANDDLKDKYEAEVAARKKAEADYEAEHKAYEDYKSDVSAKQTAAKKADAYRKQILKKAGVADKYLDDVMGVTKLDGFELGEDGNFSNADELVKAAKDKWANFIVKTNTQGADPADPPAGSNAGGIAGANPRAVQIAKERYERMYGKSEE